MQNTNSVMATECDKWFEKGENAEHEYRAIHEELGDRMEKVRRLFPEEMELYDQMMGSRVSAEFYFGHFHGMSVEMKNSENIFKEIHKN